MKQGPKQEGARGVNDTPASQEIDSSLTHPSNLKPWEDQSLDAKQRFDAYNQFVALQLEAIKNAMLRVEGDDLKGREVQFAPDTARWMEEARGLLGISAEDFCRRIDRPELRELLGKNFLGPDQWKRQQIDVGQVPPFPPSLTEALLNSECPLNTGSTIKDTHLLVLVPKTVDGEAYSALKLDELCASRKGSGRRLIFAGMEQATRWKSQEWASIPQSKSEWLLIPVSHPDALKSPQKQLRHKAVVEQDKVHQDYYPEYREVKAVELMTAVLLYDMVHKERLLPNYHQRCEEPNHSGGRVCVGLFYGGGLKVSLTYASVGYNFIGRALARKL